VFKQKKIAYLALQNYTENSAPASHVNNIVHSLKKIGINVDLYHTKVFAKNSSIKRIKNVCYDLFSIIVNINKYSLIYIRVHYAAFPVVILAKIKSIPVVQELNGTIGDFYNHRKYLKLLNSVIDKIIITQLKLSDTIITVSEG
jgi:hypothetical protein